MEAALDLTTIRLFLVFILPGLISMQVYRMVMPAFRIDWTTAVVEGLFYSAVNFALLSPILLLMHWGTFPTTYPGWYAVFAVVVLFVGPVSWPLLFRWLVRNTKFVRHLQLPYPSSWDFFFSKRIPVFVLVHLKTGELIGGFFGPESYATSFPNDGDLYLQALYDTNADGTFGDPVERTRGMIIRRDEYDYIELFSVPQPDEETENAAEEGTA